MTRQRINIKRALDDKNTRDEADRISRVREIRKLDRQGKFQAFSFDFETTHDLDKEDPVYDALAWHLDEMWHESCWCYVFGMFRGCIVLTVGAVEAGLKYRLREAGQLDDRENATFGTCICRARDCGLLPAQQGNPVLTSAFDLNTIRNSIIHANKARCEPEEALSSEGPEHEIIDAGQGLHLIHEFRPGARDALKHSRAILVYLRRHRVYPAG